MSEDESVSYLREFGLNLYESRAYLALLAGKELTAKGVGHSALVPQSRTYDVLESLERKGFAQATPATPTTYVPVPPGKILGSRYGAERKRIQGSVVRLHEQAQNRLEKLRDAYDSLTRNLPDSGGELDSQRDRVWVLQSRKNIEDALIGLVSEAKSEVLRITRPPDLKKGEQLDPFYFVGLENTRLVEDALERKVTIRSLGLTREIPTFLGLGVDQPPERRYFETPQDITEKFLLVDSRSVLLNLHDPASSSYGSIALAMESQAAASIFSDHFERMWERGTPLEKVLPGMKKLVAETAEKLKEVGFSKVQVLTYQTLAKFGATGRETLMTEVSRRRVHTQDSAEACDELTRAGLILKEKSHRLLVAEHPDDIQRAISAGTLRSP